MSEIDKTAPATNTAGPAPAGGTVPGGEGAATSGEETVPGPGTGASAPDESGGASMTDGSDHSGIHPDALFTRVFITLVAFTVIEITAAVVLDLSTAATLAVLFSINIFQVWLIASYFMHLRWDNAILRWTAGFPGFFLLVLILGVGLTTPGAVESLAEVFGF